MDAKTFGDTKAAVILAEELTKPNNIGQSSFISKNLTRLGKLLHELTVLDNIDTKRYFAQNIHNDYKSKIGKLKDPIISFYLNVVKAKISGWVEEETKKESKYPSREKAMKWWISLAHSEKTLITNGAFGLSRTYGSLTGREIEKLYGQIYKHA